MLSLRYISMPTLQGGVQSDKGGDRYRMVLVMEDHSILGINQGVLIVLVIIMFALLMPLNFFILLFMSM